MGVRFIIGEEGETDRVAMYDSVTGWAFGPVFDSPDRADHFLDWLAENGHGDPRKYGSNVLEGLYKQYIEANPKEES